MFIFFAIPKYNRNTIETQNILQNINERVLPGRTDGLTDRRTDKIREHKSVPTDPETFPQQLISDIN